MPIPFAKLLVNHCYQTKSGEIRRLTSITPNGDVMFIAYKGNGGLSAGEEEAMSGALFAEDATEDVPCPT
jgi:hypothetical protein